MFILAKRSGLTNEEFKSMVFSNWKILDATTLTFDLVKISLLCQAVYIVTKAIGDKNGY